MTKEKILLQSLASDLKRITLSIQRDSSASAERFSNEAKRWLGESAQQIEDQPTKHLLQRIDRVLAEENNLKKAEDCLMYSMILQNRSLRALRPSD